MARPRQSVGREIDMSRLLVPNASGGRSNAMGRHRVNDVETCRSNVYTFQIAAAEASRNPSKMVDLEY